MAKAFRYNPAGGKVIMDSAAVQGILAKKASSVASAADGLLGPDGYRYPGHEISKLNYGYAVRTKTDHARYAQANRKTLTKAFNKAKE